MKRILREITKLSKKYKLPVANAFHAGDGNLHPIIMFDSNDKKSLEKTEKFGEDILKLCVKFGGVLSGEHGIGVEKRELMCEMFNNNDIQQVTNYNPSDEKYKDWLDGQINPNAGVIIPLFGNEYSPESLVEIGAALNQKNTLQVVNIKEVPDQTFLDAVLIETPKIKSLKRQLSIVQDLNKLDIDFESIVTHNVSETMQILSDHLKSFQFYQHLFLSNLTIH